MGTLTRMFTPAAVPLVVLIALTGCTSDEWNQELADEFNEQAALCVEERGFEYPERGYYNTEALLSDDPAVAAFDACWAELAASERFEQLGLVPPTEFLEQTTADHFAWWKCVEESGYERVTSIPLNAEGGYPLEPTASDFGIRRDEAAIEDFYETVARCGDVDVESFKDPDGTFWYGEATGDCVEHAHEDLGDHQHGCYFADSYPGE